MVRNKYRLILTVAAALAGLGCYETSALASNSSAEAPAAQAEGGASDGQGEAPSPRSPLRVNSVDYEAQTGKLSVAGIALPGNELYLYFDDEPLAKVMPNEGGQWSLESDVKLDEGRHTLRAEQYDPVTRMLAARAMVTIGRANESSGGAPKTP